MVQDRPIDSLLGAFLISVPVVAALAFVVESVTSGRAVQSLRQSMEDFRERRRRGTRRALDWQYSSKLLLPIPLAPIYGLLGGLDLLSKEAIPQVVAGGVLVVASLVSAAALVRWRLRPVDPDSRERLRKLHESFRLRRIRVESRAVVYESSAATITSSTP